MLISQLAVGHSQSTMPFITYPARAQIHRRQSRCSRMACGRAPSRANRMKPRDAYIVQHEPSGNTRLCGDEHARVRAVVALANTKVRMVWVLVTKGVIA